MSIFAYEKPSFFPAVAKNTIRALALVLAVTALPMATATKADAQSGLSSAGQAPRKDDDKINKNQALRAYSNSGYGYCDAKKVAAVWNKNIGRAKVIIGRKIVGGLTNLIDQDIAGTAGRVNCSFQESGFNYDDAVRLSQLWNIGIGQAKDKIQYNTSQMGTKKFRIYAGL
jgi:hypothetical protein